MEYIKLRVLDRINGEIEIVSKLIELTGKTDTEKDQYLQNWISHKDFTILELHSKAPRYIQGAKRYTEYYLDISPTNEYIGKAVRKDWVDSTAPRMVSLFVSAADNTLETVTIGGDFTKEIEVGATHTILSNLQVPKGQATVASVVLNAGNTVITYVDITGVVAGDVLYFQKGLRLIGVDINISWYNKDDTTGIYKTVERRFSIAEAASYEYLRRERSMQHMIAESDGTPISPFVGAIVNHYATEINNYIKLSQAQEFKDAINAETNPVILAYLNIEITVTDIEGNSITAKIKDMIKDELYMGYY